MNKKILFTLAFVVTTSTCYAATYECYRYVNSSPTGTWIKVKANSKSEAEKIAYKRMKELGGKVDYAKCK
ncbi:MAG: hypothetical protein D3913_11845 [Candidatus Electrothrix sp. LOE1_4_5]|nr:hypothetical protein [Candidatus Electrothrix sp. AX1]MCI5118623.1 hypothetical protein [Candidatus Electrothrix gigas]MCI5183172.1 hypothetical protein [Candidatus Electrothrix gigas]